MPSREHAILVDLFRARPSLVPLLLRRFGVRLPRVQAVDIAESTFPVAVPDFHVDLAIALRDKSGRTRLVVLLEVQLAVDKDKPHRWLLYQAAARIGTAAPSLFSSLRRSRASLAGRCDPSL
jgi:hypothetical protein